MVVPCAIATSTRTDSLILQQTSRDINSSNDDSTSDLLTLCTTNDTATDVSPSIKDATKAKHRQQAQSLDAWLQINGNNLYPTREEKDRLAIELDMTYVQVNRWFANRRRKQTKRRKRDCTSAASSTGDVQNNNHSGTIPIDDAIQQQHSTPTTTMLDESKMTTRDFWAEAISALALQMTTTTDPNNNNKSAATSPPPPLFIPQHHVSEMHNHHHHHGLLTSPTTTIDDYSTGKLLSTPPAYATTAANASLSPLNLFGTQQLHQLAMGLAAGAGLYQHHPSSTLLNNPAAVAAYGLLPWLGYPNMPTSFAQQLTSTVATSSPPAWTPPTIESPSSFYSVGGGDTSTSELSELSPPLPPPKRIVGKRNHNGLLLAKNHRCTSSFDDEDELEALLLDAELTEQESIAVCILASMHRSVADHRP